MLSSKYQTPPPSTDEEKLAVTPVAKPIVVHSVPPVSLSIALWEPSLYIHEQPSVIWGLLSFLPVPLFHAWARGNTSKF